MQAVSLHTKDTYDATLNAVLIKKNPKAFSILELKKNYQYTRPFSFFIRNLICNFKPNVP